MPNWKKVIVSGSDAVLNNVTASTLQVAGNVGIGTTTPEYPLEVNGTFAQSSLKAAPNDDLNDAVYNRFFRSHTATANTASGVSSFGMGINLEYSTGNSAQLLTSRGITSPIYFRKQTNSSWGNWIKIRDEQQITDTDITNWDEGYSLWSGITATGDDWDNIDSNAFFRGHTSTVNYPPDLTQSFLSGISVLYSTTNGWQLASQRSAGANLYHRHVQNGTWASWRRLLDSDDIYVDSSGNIGIGTTSPSEKLQVNGNIAISGSNATLQLRESSAELYKFTAGGSSLDMTVDGTNAISIFQTGLVGIGTTTPNAALDVNGDAYIQNNGSLQASGSGYLRAGNINGGTVLIGGDSSTSYIQAQNNKFVLQTARAADDIEFKVGESSATSSMYIDGATGNVGVNTTTPDAVFEVVTQDSNRFVRFKSPNGEERFEFETGGSGNEARLYMYDNDGTTRNVQFVAGASALSYINGGNLGIGTTSPAYKMQIEGADGSLPLLSLKNTGSAQSEDVIMSFNRDNSDTLGFAMGIDSQDNSFKIAQDGDSINSNARLTIDSNGDVGIGTTTPTEKLTVEGTVSASNLALDSIVNAGTDTDKFLVLDSSGNVDFRTGDEVLSDIGAGTGTGDITRVNITAGNGLSGTSVDTTSGAHTQTLTVGAGTGIQVNSGDVAIDYTGTDNFIDSATNLEGTGIATGDTVVYHDATDNNVKKGFVSDLPFNNYSHPDHTGDVTSVGDGATTIVDEAVTNAKLAHMAANTVKVRNANTTGDPSDFALANTEILIGDGSGFQAASLSGDATMTNTGVVTLKATGSAAGVQGSTASGNKIDTITIDPYGRVLAVQTGETGDITGVTLTADSGTASDTTGNVDITIAGTNGIATSATGTTLTVSGSNATTTAKGVVELATTAETTTGTDTTRAVTPKGLADQGYTDNTGTVTSVGTSNGTYIDVSGGTITTTGTISADLNATGTANSTTFLRGDNTWATPVGSGGNVNATGTPVDNQLAIWTNSSTIEGDAALTFDGNTLIISESGDAFSYGAIIHDNNSATQTTGLRIQQQGTGDALLNFHLSSNNTNWTMGIDNSATDRFKIESGVSLGTNPPFAIDTADRVSIATGTAIGTHKLTVAGTVTASAFYGDGSNLTGVGGGVGVSGTPANNQLAVWTDSSTVEGDSNLTWDGTNLNINGSGSFDHLRVATPSPGTSRLQIIQSGTGGTDLDFQPQSGLAANIQTINASDLRLGTNSTSLIHLDNANSNVGIGTDNPSAGYKMAVDGDVIVGSAAASGNRKVVITAGSAGSASLHLSPNSTGNGTGEVFTTGTRDLELGVSLTPYLTIKGTTGHISSSSPITGSDFHTNSIGSYNDAFTARPTPGTPANNTILKVNNHSGTYYVASANSATTYTTGSTAVGGFAYVKINAASEPTVTGCKKISGSAFVASADMTMVVYDDGDGGRYYFLDR